MRAKITLVAAAVAAVATYLAVPQLSGKDWPTLLAGVASSGKDLRENSLRPPTPTVQAPAAAPGQMATLVVSQPIAREIVEWDETTARFDAVETVDLRTRVTGYLQEVLCSKTARKS